MQQQNPPTLSVWHPKSKSDGTEAVMPFSFSADFSVRPSAPNLSVTPHFTPKKRGRPPKASPFLDLDFNACTTSSRLCDNFDKKNLEDSKEASTTSSSTDTDDLKTDDVFIGAYLLSQLSNRSVPTCVNRQTRRTPLWRKGWRDGILKRDVLLCNACGLKYSKRQYCCYCKFIYNMKEDVLSQQNNWMDCDSCRRWVHIDCELRYGNTFTFDGRKYHGPAKYFCPDCQQEQTVQPQLQILQQQILPKPQTQQHQHQQQTPSLVPYPQQTKQRPLSPPKPLGQSLPFTLPLPIPSSVQTPQPSFPLTLPNIAFATNNASSSSSTTLLPGYDKFAVQNPFYPTASPFPSYPTPAPSQGGFPLIPTPKPEPMAF